ncbi:MAG: hypothetical protein M3R41_11035 [Pseudomonadota bacterium]|nr:hypothetical protein [Pseudomonadota bacterium]
MISGASITDTGNYTLDSVNNTREPDQDCGSACKKDPLGGVIGVQQGPLISMV